MTYIELVPAYGRDYTSQKAVLADWNAGKDWQDPMSGRYANIHDFVDGHEIPMLRYAKLTKVVIPPRK